MYLPLGNSTAEANGEEFAMWRSRCRDLVEKKNHERPSECPRRQDIYTYAVAWWCVIFQEWNEERKHMPTNDNLCNFRFKLNKNNNNNNNGILNERTKNTKIILSPTGALQPPSPPGRPIRPRTIQVKCVEGTTTTIDNVRRCSRCRRRRRHRSRMVHFRLNFKLKIQKTDEKSEMRKWVVRS